MAKTAGTNNESRIPIQYFDGVNAAVQPSLGKITELSHAENARAPLIGVLEKRQGQAKVGTTVSGGVFYAEHNYGLGKMRLTDTNYQGVFRISSSKPSSLTISVFENIFVSDVSFGGQNTLKIMAIEDIFVSEPNFFVRKDGDTLNLDGTTISLASIYSLTSGDVWASLTDSSAQNILGDKFDFTHVSGYLVLVNGLDYNRTISADGVTVTDSTEPGNLYNSPRAKKTAYYKSRLYLANFINNGIKYGTSVLRSSYPLGIVALVNGDVTSSATIEVTDTNYFYTQTGMNQYEIHRGGTKIGSDITVTSINETSIVVSAPVTLLSSDEIWVAGTYSGEKQYRWINNPSSTGRDVKQYDSFKLSGGEESEITLLNTIGNILLIGNADTLMTWNDYTLQNLDLGIGCVSQNGSVKLLGTMYFIHYSGVYSTTGAAPTLMSRKVERYIRGATKEGLENAAAGFKGTSVFFSIGDVTLYNSDGSFWKILKDTCLEFSVVDQKWYVHTNVPAEQFLSFINTSGAEQLLFEHAKGEKSIKEFLVGTSDDGEEIFFRADSNEIQFMKEFEYSVNPKSIVTDLHRGALMTTMVSLDGDDFYQIEGTNKKGIATLKITPRDKSKMEPVACKKLQISFRESSKQLCRIAKAAVIYTPTSLTTPEE
jgi:hypothetical protein